MDPTRLPHKTSLLCGCLSSRLSAVCCPTLILLPDGRLCLFNSALLRLCPALPTLSAIAREESSLPHPAMGTRSSGPKDTHCCHCTIDMASPKL